MRTFAARLSLVTVAAGIAATASAADPPEVIHHTTGMNIPITAEQVRSPSAASQPATQPRTRPAPDDERIYDFVDRLQPVFIPPPVRSTVFWSRANELWLYKPNSMKYTPILDFTYHPNLDFTYTPKRDFTFVPKRSWSYTPRIW